jgi:hypothetical protein
VVGCGSPHTPRRYIWPLGLMVQVRLQLGVLPWGHGVQGRLLGCQLQRWQLAAGSHCSSELSTQPTGAAPVKRPCQALTTSKAQEQATILRVLLQTRVAMGSCTRV